MIQAVVETDVLLELMLSDGATTFFPQAEVYDDAGAIIVKVDLATIGIGLYQGKFLAANNTAIGDFSIGFIVYQDAGHTIVANKYDRVAEHLLVESPEGGAA